MSIQFHCLACGQPIEVDDDAANQPVTCPYCRRVSTAPPMTAPNFDAKARPVGGTQGRPLTPGHPSGQPTPYAALPPISEGNKLAWWSLGLIAATLLMLIPSSIMSASIMSAIPASQDAAWRMREFQEQAATHTGLQWLSGALCILPLAALTLSVISLIRGGRPKWPAYTTLGILTAGILLFCLGTILQASLGAGA